MAGVGGYGFLVRSLIGCSLWVLAKTADGISTIGGRIGVSAAIGLLCQRRAAFVALGRPQVTGFVVRLTLGSSDHEARLRWAKEAVDDWYKATSFIMDAVPPRRATLSLDHFGGVVPCLN